MRIVAVISLCICAVFTARADMVDDALFRAHVKSVEEFIARFNGDERSPMAPADSLRSPVLALFSFGYVDSQDPDSMAIVAREFVDSIDAAAVRLSLTDPRTRIEAECVFSSGGRKFEITLVFVMEEFKPGFRRLALADACGIERSGLLVVKPMYPISPVEHELHFMALEDLFAAKRDYLPSTLPRGRSVDSLSYLIALLQCGHVAYEECTDVAVVSAQVPGFEFRIREIVNPKSFNSGWLITDLCRISEN